MKCGSLNENDLYRLNVLNIWFLLCGTIWEGLGGVTLLGEACHWGWTFRLQKSMLFPGSSVCLILDIGCKLQLLLQAKPDPCHDGHGL